jgi:hypothetical protein
MFIIKNNKLKADYSLLFFFYNFFRSLNDLNLEDRR